MAVQDINFNILDNNNLKKEVKFPYPWKSTKMGQPIPKTEAKILVQEKVWENETGNFDASIVFEAAPLLLLLSQEGCVGIRFYKAKKEKPHHEKNDETLVLVGVDSKNNDLNVPVTNSKIASIMTDLESQERSIIIEVGGGDKLNEFL